jgi:hypothetical protein
VYNFKTRKKPKKPKWEDYKDNTQSISVNHFNSLLEISVFFKDVDFNKVDVDAYGYDAYDVAFVWVDHDKNNQLFDLDMAEYEKKLEAYNVWYKENKELILEQERRSLELNREKKEKEKKKLQKEIEKQQKKLERLQKEMEE